MATRNPVNSPVEVGSLSHYLQGFIYPKWLFGISAINSTTLMASVYGKLVGIYSSPMKHLDVLKIHGTAITPSSMAPNRIARREV